MPGGRAWKKKRPKKSDGSPTGPRELIDDLAAVAWSVRRVYVTFDSDAVANPPVRAAERALAPALAAAGAVPVVVRLPAGPGGEKQGLDDFLARCGPYALRELQAAADAPPDPAEPGGSKGDSNGDGAGAVGRRPARRYRVPRSRTVARLDAGGVATVGRRTVPVRSKAFRNGLTNRFRSEGGGRVPTSKALANAVNAIEA